MLFKKITQFVFHGIRHLFYLIWLHCFRHSVKPNLTIEVDVVIPIIEKDLLILPLCIESVKNNVVHPIKDIYIVAPDCDAIKAFTLANNLRFVDENTVMGYSPKDINLITKNGLNRSGWMFQQLIKLSGQIGTSRYFLAIDADHILLKPHTFITEDNRMVFYMSSWWHFPYLRNIKKLIKFYPRCLLSYISHKMIFDKEELKALHSTIETRNTGSNCWDKIILSYFDTSESSGFSEFELYGNYIPFDKKIFLPWREKALTEDSLSSYTNLKMTYSKYLSITFSSYLNKEVISEIK